MSSRVVTDRTRNSQVQRDAPKVTCLVLDLPAGSFCGIDLLSFTTGAQFQGIKCLNTGYHIIYVAETSAFSLREGYWFYVPKTFPADQPPLIVFRWLRESGTLERLPQEEVDQYCLLVTQIWTTGLTPYRQGRDEDDQDAAEADWQHLTMFIRPRLLRHLTQHDQYRVSSASCAKEDHETIPGMDMTHAGLVESELGSLKINLKKTWKQGTVGRNLTHAAMDKSWALKELVRERCSLTQATSFETTSDDGGHETSTKMPWGSVILGQMQASFILVLTLGNYSCLEEWKRCIGLVLTCQEVIMEQQQFFVYFLNLLNLQLRKSEIVDGGIFDMSVDSEDKVQAWLRQYTRTIARLQLKSDHDISLALHRLNSLVHEQYGWDLNDNFVRRGQATLEDGERVELDVADMDEEDESGEYAPVVVEMENQNYI